MCQVSKTDSTDTIRIRSYQHRGKHVFKRYYCDEETDRTNLVVRLPEPEHLKGLNTVKFKLNNHVLGLLFPGHSLF